MQNRKRYFSSAERLDIAQRLAAQKRKKDPVKRTWLCPGPTSDAIARPATSPGFRRLSSHSPSRDPKLILVRFDQGRISQEQATWFLTLPDKVRKQRFTREEQISLMVQCKIVLERAAPELAKDVYVCALNINREEDSAPNGNRISSSSFGLEAYRTDNILDTIDSSTPSCEGVDTEMAKFKPHSRRRAVSDATTQSTVVPAAPPPPRPEDLANAHTPKRKHLRRAMSLTPLPLPPPTLAPLPPVPSPDPNRRFALSARLSRPYFETMPSEPELEPEPEAKHYQDPDARKWLLESLSPRKFDVALEFGFSAPSNESTYPPSKTSPSFPIQQPPSWHSESADEYDESLETLSPQTPTTFSDDEHAAIKQTSFDSGIGLALHQNLETKTPPTHSPASSVGDREMTIRMTPTRPNLRTRTPEDDLYSHQRQQTSGVNVDEVDPLALESLPVCDDPTGAHGAFAVHDNGLSKGLRRVWQTLKRY